MTEKTDILTLVIANAVTKLLHKAVTRDKFWTKTNFPAQIIKLCLHNYLVFIKLMSSGSNKKSIKTHQIKIPKKTQVSSPWKKLKKCSSKSLNHTRKI